MNTDPKSTASQLRLAADTLETGHPWETSHTGERWWAATPSDDPAIHVVNKQQIRPILATPPDGRPLHNPDNLTAEQVGVGYRLTVEGEPPHEDAQLWHAYNKKWGDRLSSDVKSTYSGVNTYRLPLSVPWPDAPEAPDPYAELKKAHAAGKVIQYNCGDKEGEPIWEDVLSPVFSDGPECYRIKPDASPFQLPPPPPDMKWHRVDGWKTDDLPPGTRPLVKGEKSQTQDEHWAAGMGPWKNVGEGGFSYNDNHSTRCRTTRPLVFTHEGKQWTYHRPGDPMPCDGERKVEVVFRNLEISPSACRGSSWLWKPRDAEDDIIGWRYAEPVTKEVELGPEDVPPGSVMRPGHWTGPVWIKVNKVCITDCRLEGEKSMTWEYLKTHGYQINYPRHRDSSGNPTLWFPCHKTIPQNG